MPLRNPKTLIEHIEYRVAELNARYEQGVAEYRKWHPPNRVVTPLLDVWEEGPDFDHMVAPHKRAYEEAVRVLDRLRLAVEAAGATIAESVDLVATRKFVSDLSTVFRSARQLTPGLIDHLRENSDDIAKLHPEAFEHLVGLYLKDNGFDEVRLVGRDSHTSADIFAIGRIKNVDMTFRVYVEVKRTSRSLKVMSVDAVIGAFEGEKAIHGWHAAILLALQGFSRFKKYSPEQLVLRGLELRTGNDLKQWLTRYEPNENGLWLPKGMP